MAGIVDKHPSPKAMVEVRDVMVIDKPTSSMVSAMRSVGVLDRSVRSYEQVKIKISSRPIPKTMKGKS